MLMQKVEDALKEHAASVREPIVLHPINFVNSTGSMTRLSSHTVEDTSAIWQKIYNNPELNKSVWAYLRFINTL